MNNSDDLIELESTIVYNLRPTFLSIVHEKEELPFIHIIVSHPSFNNKPMKDRINYIFSLIKDNNLDILNRVTIIVEAFSSSEMEDLFEHFV